MKYMKRLAALAIAFSLVVPVYAASVTVGDFVTELARVKQLDAVDAQTAADSLAAAGIRIPSDLDLGKQLTEADVARLSQLMGLKVSSSSPDRAFSGEQVDQFFVAFGEDIAGGQDDDFDTRNGETPGGESGSANGNGPGFNPYTKGKGGAKGKKKGHGGPVSPTEPE